MNKFYKFSTILILSILTLVISGFSQVSEKKIQRLPYSDNCKVVRDFFLDALITANQPGGLIITRNSCPENVVFPEYKPAELSLDEKLNLITQMNPNYMWKYEQGVINLAPTKSLPELFKIKILNFKATNVYNLPRTMNEIFELPEVAENLKRLNLKQGIQFGGLTSPPNKRLPLEKVFKDKTLRQILNEVVRERGRGVWVYNESHFNGDDTFSLEFLVQ